VDLFGVVAGDDQELTGEFGAHAVARVIRTPVDARE
jgi:hypothetical protein